MCIAVYSDVPLGIVFLQEQIWCQPTDDELRVQECYDMVIANHGPNGTRTMSLISPHVLFDPKAKDANAQLQIELPSVDKTPHLNWYMLVEGDKLSGPVRAGGKIEFTIPRYARPGIPPEYFPFSCVPLEGEVTFHGNLRGGSESLWRSFRQLGCTVAEVRFRQVLEPYAKSKELYWVRLVLEPSQLNHRVSARVLSPLRLVDCDTTQGTRYCIQPCEVMAPDLVFQKTRSLLDRLRTMHGESSDLAELDRAFVKDGFDRDESVSWIEDHRISVVTRTDAVVMDSQKLGAVAFHMVEAAGNADLHAWSWNAGMQHFPYEDAYVVASTVFNYLRGRAEREELAVSRAQIIHETGLPASNAYFALEVLKQERILGATHGGYYYYLKEKADALDRLRTEAQVRVAMARVLELGRSVRYPGRSFLVQFSVLWAV